MHIIEKVSKDLDGLADVDGECHALSDDPIRISPLREHFGSNAHRQGLAAWVYRGSDFRSLHFEMHVGTLHPDTVDFGQAFRLLPGRSRRFACISIENERDPEDELTGGIIVSVTYDLPVTEVRAGSVRRIVTDIVLTWKRMMTMVGALRSAARTRARREAARVSEISAARDDIHKLVGIEPAKRFVDQLVAIERFNQLRQPKGLPAFESSPHLAFTGPPGTGKTTVARTIGRLYKSLGLLPDGHVIEVGRSQLVGRYLGHTAIKTREACEAALGGVLFIDEAYSLHTDGRDYGSEAIEEIMLFMENNRGSIAVIFAGYDAPIESLLDSNPGLRSRVDNVIHFPSLSADQLVTIATEQFEAHRCSISPSATALLGDHFARARSHPHFANARDVRKVVQRVLKSHAEYVVGAAHPTTRDLIVIPDRVVADAVHGLSQPATRRCRESHRPLQHAHTAGYL